ncbi:MAG: hypothetical protein JAZ15_21965 [Candidatus Thiodiazotropha endolucinida]|nr:hypothetical protein [Candidatus Thiodiazotropha taylori]MCW4315684.1 hypothetical protein [Candidatus Thiodiazotropha taylori]
MEFTDKPVEELRDKDRYKPVIGGSVLPLISALLFLLGFLIPIGQVVYFLWSGKWFPISVLTPFEYFEFTWVSSPNSWYGIHMVLTYVPLSLSLIAIGVLVGYIIESDQ